MTEKNVILVGTGNMAGEYYKSLVKEGYTPLVIGNSEKSTSAFNEKYGASSYPGSIEENRDKLAGKKFDVCFITVNEHAFNSCLRQLSEFEIDNYVVEKPGAFSPDDLKDIYSGTMKGSTSSYYIAYNRRFYSSVLELKKRLLEEGGAKSAFFEFTELTDRVLSLNIPEERLKNWLFLNSSHVIDLAFHLIGWPKQMSSLNFGQESWHGSGDFFSGIGLSDKDIPFSYVSNWNAPGRWSIEVLTEFRRYALRPLEGLVYQERNKFDFVEVPIEIDKEIKEGIYPLVKSCLAGDFGNLVEYKSQNEKLKVYEIIKIGGGF